VTSHALSSPLLAHPRRLALMAGAGVFALASVLVVGRLLEIQQRAQNHVVEVGASYMAIPNLEALTKRSDLVVVGRVVGQGKTHLVAQPTPQPQPFQPAPAPQVSADKAELLKNHNPVASAKSDIPAPNMDLPVTEFTVQVQRVLRGSTARQGQITVTQSGGTVELPTFPGGPNLSRTLEMEHDPLMTAGQEHVLFLTRATNGRYYVTGGPQGRFSVDTVGKIHPVDPAAPAARGHAGKTLEGFAAEVQTLAQTVAR